MSIPCSERPGPLYLDRGAAGSSDNRIYVAATVTGNNSTFPGIGSRQEAAGSVFDLDGFGGGELPDEDVFRIDPFAQTITSAVRGAGSLLFDIDRNPETGNFWVLSSDSNNKDPAVATEAAVSGIVAINQLQILAGNTSGLVQAPATGIDLDDHDPGTAGA